ncbi:MAG TPA: hypothetical protein VER76_19695 [Pyrinomonadaceae bacterium]|nr:hypothetical protein [Pyrinomonadaceae bacterium]
MNDTDIYLLFSAQFRMIDDNLDDLVKKAEGFVQANAIIDSWKQANLNYLKARNKIFSTHAEQIADLVKHFDDSQKSIKKALEDLKGGAATIGKVTKVISAAVDAGKKLQEAV